MENNEDAIVSAQRAAKSQKGESLAISPINDIDALVIILAKGGDKFGRYCVIPRGGYGPKG